MVFPDVDCISTLVDSTSVGCGNVNAVTTLMELVGESVGKAAAVVVVRWAVESRTNTKTQKHGRRHICEMYHPCIL